MNIRHLIVSIAIVAAAISFGERAYSADPAIQPGVAYAPNTVLLKFRPGTPAGDKADVRASLGLTLEHSYTIVPGLELLTSKTQDVPELLERLSRNPNVEFVEPDYEVSIGLTPDDSRFGSLWGIQRIGAPAAWDTTTGSQQYVVAVIDTGVDVFHEDLATNIWVNPGEIPGNGQDDDGNGYIDDINGYDFVSNDNDPADGHGHGTHVSGTICGRGNNAIGVAGVNWQCRIMGLKFLSDSGSGSTSNAVKALDYAVAKGVRVSNNSWGGGGYSSSLAQALTNAGNAGHLFVAAAGNSNVNTDLSPHYPSSYSHANVISVASTTSSDARSSFSNYGLNSVDLGAPGSSILSTLPNDSYASWSGTSMATPHVAGAVALLASYHPGWTAQQLKDTILTTVEPLASLNGKTLTGGLLDVEAAIASANGNLSPTAEFTETYSGVLGVNFTDNSTDPDGTITARSWDFDDGNSSSTKDPSHTYICSGEYYVALTVTDDDGATDTAIHPVTVPTAGADTMPPTITAPPDIETEATGPTTAVDLGTPTVNDDADCYPSVTNDAPSGFATGETTVTWTATDSSNNSATATQLVTVVVPAFHDQLATGSSTQEGTVSGDYRDTHGDDDTAQVLTEEGSGGKPSNRRSSLQHTWTFEVSPGSSITLRANAWVSGPADVDDYIFAWSQDGASYTNAFTVSSANSGNMQTAALPATLSGTVYVQVTDSDNGNGEIVLGELSVDHLVIRTDNQPVVLPAAPTGLSAAAVAHNQVDLGWTDNADNETAYEVERAQGSVWALIATLAPDTTTYSDMTVSPATSYDYRVRAMNGTEPSVYSNTTSAATPTDPANPRTLSAAGYKVKGVHTVDLSWSGLKGESVIIKRNDSSGTTEISTSNDGFETDSNGAKGGGSYVYQVCETSGDCTNTVTIVF